MHLSVNVRHTRIHLQCLLEARALYYSEQVNVHETVLSSPGNSQYFCLSPPLFRYLRCAIKAIILLLHNTTTQHEKARNLEYIERWQVREI